MTINKLPPARPAPTISTNRRPDVQVKQKQAPKQQWSPLGIARNVTKNVGRGLHAVAQKLNLEDTAGEKALKAAMKTGVARQLAAALKPGSKPAQFDLMKDVFGPARKK